MGSSLSHATGSTGELTSTPGGRLTLPPMSARSNEEVALVLLTLASDLLRENHPAIAHMIRYALAEIEDDR